VGFVVDKVALGQFSPSTSVPAANLHSTNYSTITIYLGLGQSGAGAGFLRVLRFPLPIFIPPIAP
jgi:hypothetical protein